MSLRTFVNKLCAEKCHLCLGNASTCAVAAAVGKVSAFADNEWCPHCFGWVDGVRTWKPEKGTAFTAPWGKDSDVYNVIGRDGKHEYVARCTCTAGREQWRNLGERPQAVVGFCALVRGKHEIATRAEMRARGGGTPQAESNEQDETTPLDEALNQEVP